MCWRDEIVETRLCPNCGREYYGGLGHLGCPGHARRRPQSELPAKPTERSGKEELATVDRIDVVEGGFRVYTPWLYFVTATEAEGEDIKVGDRIVYEPREDPLAEDVAVRFHLGWFLRKAPEPAVA